MLNLNGSNNWVLRWSLIRGSSIVFFFQQKKWPANGILTMFNLLSVNSSSCWFCPRLCTQTSPLLEDFNTLYRCRVWKGAEVAHSCSNTGKNDNDGIIIIRVRPPSAQWRNARNLTFYRESLENSGNISVGELGDCLSRFGSWAGKTKNQ